MNSIKIFFYLFLIFLPFGTRVLVYKFTTGFHEYEAVFLYASDIFLVLFLLTLFFISRGHIFEQRIPQASSLVSDEHRTASRGAQPLIGRWSRWTSGSAKRLPESDKIFLTIFLVFAGISIFWSWSGGLAVYNFVRLVLLVLMALAVAKILREGIVKLESIFAVIAGSAVLQSLIGFIQFVKQSSLGLGFLGESVLGSTIGGTAKIIVEGAPIMRAYGTFAHPNVLAAFLVLGLLSCYYLFFQFYEARPRKILSAFGIFIIILGLILTFSRAAWFIAALSSISLIGYWLLINRGYRKKAIFLLLILFIVLNSLFLIFYSFIGPRVQISAAEPAVTYRLVYNRMSLDLIRNRPLGVGIGNQVLYSVKNGIYEKFGMDQVWQWQPIHNIYLLIGSEIGVLGLLAFLGFIAGLLIFNFQFTIYKKFLNFSISQFLISLLLFGLFDHFLWTLQPGRLMLWLTIGILMGVLSARGSKPS